ncbi:MAG: hypothetical protein AAFV53_30940, partial [Myxococcota bacterium]
PIRQSLGQVRREQDPQRHRPAPRLDHRLGTLDRRQLALDPLDHAHPPRGHLRRSSLADPHNQRPTHLAYVSRIGGRFDVHVVKLDNKKVTRLTQDMGDNEDPSWGPNSQYVAFSSTRTGAAHIWMSTIDGVHQVQLTQGGGGYTNPSWSPPLDW